MDKVIIPFLAFMLLFGILTDGHRSTAEIHKLNSFSAGTLIEPTYTKPVRSAHSCTHRAHVRHTSPCRKVHR